MTEVDQSSPRLRLTHGLGRGFSDFSGLLLGWVDTSQILLFDVVLCISVPYEWFPC